MKEQELNKSFYLKRIGASLVILLLVWLLAKIPADAGEIPIIKGDWSYKISDVTYTYDSSSLPDGVGLLVVRSSQGVNYAFFYSTNPFKFTFKLKTVWDSGYKMEHNIDVSSSLVKGLYVYSSVLYAYGYSNNADSLYFYHASSGSTGSMTPTIQLLEEVSSDIVTGDIYKNGKLSDEFLEILLPKINYEESLGYVKINDFKKINLEHGLNVEIDGIKYSTVTDSEYQFVFNRYSTTGVDLLHQWGLANTHSNSKYDNIELNVVAQPVIYYIDKNNNPIESPYSGKTHSIWFGENSSNSDLHLNFSDIPREGFSIRQSQLDEMISEAFSDIESLRSDLVNPHDALYVVWRFLFKLEGHFWDEHHAVSRDYDYGPTLIVTLPSSFDFDKEPVISTQGVKIDLDSGNVEIDSFYDKSQVIGSVSSGITWDEAYLDSMHKTPSSGSGGLDLTDDNNILDNTKSLLLQISGFPEIIRSLFIFMPSWVLTLYSVGFSLLIVLVIYKLARG